MASTSKNPVRSRGPRTVSKQRTLVLMVRHARTPTTGKVLPGRAKGLNLSDQGRAQAERLSQNLYDWQADLQRPRSSSQAGVSLSPVTAIYSSSLERARQTAAPIASSLGLKVALNKGLLECDFGDWTGESLTKLARLPEWGLLHRHPSQFTFPGGESIAQMQLRVTSTLRELAARHVGETVIAVSHADPIKAAVIDALGSHLDMFGRVTVSTASMTAVEYTSFGPRVIAVNMTASPLEALS